MCVCVHMNKGKKCATRLMPTLQLAMNAIAVSQERKRKNPKSSRSSYLTTLERKSTVVEFFSPRTEAGL